MELHLAMSRLIESLGQHIFEVRKGESLSVELDSSSLCGHLINLDLEITSDTNNLGIVSNSRKQLQV